MLVANLERERIEARHATKGAPFVCPGCEAPVILKRGRLRIAHFAHAARTDCGWSKGETMAHRVAKLALADALRLRGLRAEVEFEVATPHGMRRADVLAWHPQRDENERGGMLAFELQHTPISLEEIEERAFSYAAAGVAQVWIPFLRKSAIERGRLDTAGLFISPGYSPRPFEDWVIEHDWRDGIRPGMWMYEPEQERYYFGEFFPEYRWIEGSTYYEDGEEVQTGQYFKAYEKWVILALSQPLEASELRFRVVNRAARKRRVMRWPRGPVIAIEPASGAPYRFKDRGGVMEPPELPPY